MARAECAQGHQYDSDLYPSCPYCNGFQVINLKGAPADQAGRTMPLSGGSSASPQNGGGRSIMGDDGKTMPPWGYGRRVDEDNRTKGMIQKKNGIEPVVGWLICIEGSEKGKDYRLYGRINTVGRDERMDVCIHGDQGITRDVHVRIGYDPKKNNFHIIPANSSNNTYVNDEPVYIPTKLAAYDVIELGETKLLFLPLCSRKFSWGGGLVTGGLEDGMV